MKTGLNWLRGSSEKSFESINLSDLEIKVKSHPLTLTFINFYVLG